MSEDRPDTSSKMRSANQNPVIRKSSRLMKTSQNVNSRTLSNESKQGNLNTPQDSLATTSNALPSPTTLEDDAPTTSSIGAGNKETTSSTGKSRIPWDPVTENLFFDALKMYGKDYDAITKYITQKAKSTNAKNYEQVRNYYHNTTTKVLAAVDLAEIDVSKEIKELFALINYGEWKRITNINKLTRKAIKLFKDLVLNGWTTVKIAKRTQGKAIGRNKLRTRVIRTPLCPALKKFIESRDDVSVDTNVPKTVVVEFSPNSERDRAYVLLCWQNPFVRFVLNLNQPFDELLRWLQHKWIPQDLRLKKTVLGEDITQELAEVTVYPSPDMVLRAANLRTVSRRAVSAPSTSGATAAPLINVGLRHCFANAESCLPSAERSEKRRPGSPAKNDRRRRKLTPAENQSHDHAEPNAGSKPKRPRADVTSAPDEEGNATEPVRRFSDGGETSSDNCPIATAAIETDDEREAPEFAAAGPSSDVANQSNNAKQPTADTGIAPPLFGLDSSAHGLTLNPDQLRQGITLSTCRSLTAGQLYLLCDRAATIRLKYSVTPKTAPVPTDAEETWKFFISLVRSDFTDILHKKSTAQSKARLPKSTKRGYGGCLSTAINKADKPTSSITSVVAPSQSGVVDAALQPAGSGTVIGGPIFAKPTHKILPRNKAVDGQATFYTVHPFANESSAFLAQMGQMVTKKPIVVNRRCTVVAPSTVATEQVVIPSHSTSYASTSHVQNCGLFDAVSMPNVVGEQQMQQQGGTACDTAAADAAMRWAPMDSGPNAHSMRPQTSSSISAQVFTPATADGTLNTPDVTRMHISQDAMARTAEVTHGGFSAGLQQTGPITAVASVQNQDIITSDSFLDFSLSSFTGFNAKLGDSSHGATDRNSLSGVLSSLHFAVDDSALSSPPRPIRTNTRKSEKGNYQLTVPIDLEQCPSTSNLFSLLDTPLDNESAATRDLFAQCAVASTLETPKKCKSDD